MNPKIQKLIDDHIDRLTSSLMFEVEATLRSVEFYSQRIPDLAEWLCGDLTIDPGGRIVGDYLLKMHHCQVIFSCGRNVAGHQW